MMPSPSTGASGTAADNKHTAAVSTSSGIEYAPLHRKGLAQKLTCSVLSVIFSGMCLILVIQVALTLSAVPSWGADTKEAMIALEKENILKLASDKAEFVDEIFGRVQEGLLQVQAFAGQSLLEEPETMIVDQYVMSFPGLEQSVTTWDHSVWLVTDFGVGDAPEAGSTLEGLLNRSSLMDVPFRGMNRQHLLVYLASLDDPSPATGEVSQINRQSYAGFDMLAAGFGEFDQECDSRFIEYGEGYVPMTYEPRCRVWYQDAVEGGNTGVAFTNPYTDVDSERLVVTLAAPVLDTNDTLLGVVGLDMNFTEIESSINDLKVVGDEGYAYILAPGGDGEVAVHFALEAYGGTQDIFDLEPEVDEEEFGAIVTKMSEECTGSEVYSKDGSPWILSWKHETVSASGGSGSDGCGDGGFIVVVTVSESALLKAFSQIESEIRYIVGFASGIMAAILVGIACLVVVIARGLSAGIASPVKQLVDVVQALNRMDFSEQAAGTWMVNEVASPEVVELMSAFEAMTTILKFATMSLMSGNIDLAKKGYRDALTLFLKLGNKRGVSIVSNNLGNVDTLKAREVSMQAAKASSKARAEELGGQADSLYMAAIGAYRLSIDEAKILYDSTKPQDGPASPLAETSEAKSKEFDGGESKYGDNQAEASCTDVEVGGRALVDGPDYEKISSFQALAVQLSNRKFNLALCLASKARTSSARRGSESDMAAVNEARQLMMECVQLAAHGKDGKDKRRHFGYLLELADLECQQKGREREAKDALDAAEHVLTVHGGDMTEGRNTTSEMMVAEQQQGEPPARLDFYRQRLLAARGLQCVAAGESAMAIGYLTGAILHCGDRMDIDAVGSALTALRAIVSRGGHAYHLPSELLLALNLTPGARKDAGFLLSAIDSALYRLHKVEASARGTGAAPRAAAGRPLSPGTSVDLCFVMDCTGSMQSWIDQAKNKLVDIIEQAKADVSDMKLRVAFVGYRDFGDTKRYEGPFDFHTEKELPDLLDKLKNIKAVTSVRFEGGRDFPEDVVGGLDLATKLSWRSPIRLCILIADAPCHGTDYHDVVSDRFPEGCPSGLNPVDLLYRLKYELSVDFYFIRITRYTDKMIKVWDKQVSLRVKKANLSRSSLHGKNDSESKIVVHKLGEDDNRFLEAVVSSVSHSIKLVVEKY